MELDNLEIVPRGGETRIRCRVRWRGGEDELWYGVDARHAGFLAADRYDGFAVALLLKAMALGEDLHVRGTLSSRLHGNLNRYYGSIVSQVVAGTRPVAIHADRLDEGPGARAAGVGTGFSAGVDSFAVLHDHWLAEQRPGWRVTHLLFNNVGSHGEHDAAAAALLFRQRYEAVRGWPEDAGLEFIRVDSNLSSLLRMDFQQTHTPRNLSVALLMQPLFGRYYYYASTYRYRDCHVGPAHDMAYADPCAVHLLSTERLDAISTGSQHTRVEKTRLVARVPGAPRWLNVCANVTAGGRNCSTCAKCCRTLLTLELLGELGAFSGTFDLDTWRRVRNRYVSSEVLNRGRPSPFTTEILEYAAGTGHPFTARQHAARVLNLLPRPLLRLGRSVRRRWLGGP